MRMFTSLLLIFLVLLQYRLWFGKNSVPDQLALENKIALQQQTNEKSN